MAIRSTTIFAEVLALTGMTQAEAAEYLDISVPTVRSYCQGAARTQIDPLIALWHVAKAVMRGEELPAAAPESCRRRQQVVRQMGLTIDRAMGIAIPYPKLNKLLKEEFEAIKAAKAASE